MGAVEKIDKQHVQLVQQGYIPQQDIAEKIQLLSQHTSDLLHTAEHNTRHDKSETNFQREVVYADIPESAIQEFKKYSHEKSLELLIDFDRWLAEKKKTTNNTSDEKKGRVGVGIYYFNNDKDED